MALSDCSFAFDTYIRGIFFPITAKVLLDRYQMATHSAQVDGHRRYSSGEVRVGRVRSRSITFTNDVAWLLCNLF